MLSQGRSMATKDPGREDHLEQSPEPVSSASSFDGGDSDAKHLASWFVDGLTRLLDAWHLHARPRSGCSTQQLLQTYGARTRHQTRAPGCTVPNVSRHWAPWLYRQPGRLHAFSNRHPDQVQLDPASKALRLRWRLCPRGRSSG